MTRYLLDTNCIVAAVCTWHEHHQSTLAELERRSLAREEAVLAAPTLVEAYAVLTRLPPPYRLGHDEAFGLLEANWGATSAVALTGAETWRVLREARAAGVGGGLVYDALVAACARKARAATLLTWNVRHLERFGGSGLAVVAPVE
jgi:predicted nucleic acid-binding protein